MHKAKSITIGRVNVVEFYELNEKGFKLYNATAVKDAIIVGKTQLLKPPVGEDNFLVAIIIDQSSHQIMRDLLKKWEEDVAFITDIVDKSEAWFAEAIKSP